MRPRFTFWPLIILLVTVFCLAQEGEKKQKEGEKTAPATAAAAQDATAQPVHGFRKFTEEELARKNPQKFTTVSVERGKKIYATQCLMCHGEKGDGKGDLAVEMNLSIPDITKPGVLQKRTDGELYAMIEAGNSVMPGQGTRMKDYRKWQLVNYLRALSGKEPEKSTGNEPEEGIVLIPQ